MFHRPRFNGALLFFGLYLLLGCDSSGTGIGGSLKVNNECSAPIENIEVFLGEYSEFWPRLSPGKGFTIVDLEYSPIVAEATVALEVRGERFELRLPVAEEAPAELPKMYDLQIDLTCGDEVRAEASFFEYVRDGEAMVRRRLP